MPIRHYQKRQLPPANPPPPLVEISVQEVTIIQPDGPHTFVLKAGTNDAMQEDEKGNVEVYEGVYRYTFYTPHIYSISSRYNTIFVPAPLAPRQDPA